jgi:PEP-CTERM motif
MKKPLAAIFAALLILSIVPAAGAGTIIYHDVFNGSASANLNGTAPDVDNNGGTNTWAANTGYKLSGLTPSASLNTGAYLPFTAVAGNLYTLSASFTGIGPDGTSVAWHALGFGKSMPTTTLESGENRFVSGATIGRAWMLFRPNNPTGNANMLHRGNASSGTGTGTTPQPWNDPSLLFVEGGDIDMQILLDTSPVTWTATYFAKRPADSSYTQVSVGALPLLAQDIGMVGIARTTNTAGTTMTGSITTFDLSFEPVPEPASSILLMLGMIAFGVTSRRKQ